MSDREGLCWKCVHRETCTMFNRDRDAVTVDCGRFLMTDADKAIMQAIYSEFFESEG